MSVGSQSVVKPAAGLAQPQAKTLSGRLSALGGPLLVLALAIGAAVLFRRELQQHSWVELRGCVLNLGPWVFAAAALWTAANYAVLVLTDCVAIYSVGSKVSTGRVVLGSFLGYAIGNSLGASVAGTAIRVRLYSRWGMSAAQQIRSIAAVAITFWLGVFALAGAAIAVRPIELPKHLGGDWVGSRAIGLVFLGLVAGYMLFAAVRRRPLHVRSLVLDPPGFRVACAQLAIGLADSLTAAAVLYSLLPEGWHAAGGSGSFLTFLPIYLIAVTAGLMSHVPGGLGVFELVMLWLTPGEADAALLSSLLAYRVLYYLAPLAIGVATMTVLEFAAVRKRVSPVVAVGRVWLNWLSPRLITAGVFCAGLVLLASGSWPTVDQRLEILCEALPLGAIEASHFFASVVGVVLLLLARGLQRRIDAAYWATLAMLGFGAVASLAKGLDYEESILLLLIAAALAPSHKYFFRQGKLFQPDLNWHWWAAIGGSIGCAVWLTMFAYQGVEYRRELWWEFAFDSDAPRSLRALAGASAVVVVAAVLNALRPVRCLPAEPTEEQLRRASEIVGDSPRASAALALLGDKRFVFSDDQQAFVMFGVEGRTWVAMGDAVGPKASAASAAWNFREMCRHRHVWPAFYQVDESNLGLYVDMGMRLFKLGEEAVVPLEEFSLEGPKRRDLRYTNKKVGQSGCRLEVVRAADVEARMDDLQEISDAWMAGRAGTEKGFSLGCFDPDYLRHFDVAMVYVGDEPIAFANVWQGAQREEYSIDLMRFKPDRVYGVMEWMFIQLMLHAKAEGYRWFNLGMAPLSGIESYEGSPLWNKLSSLAFRHGEHFYNFQGLRHYKSKFDPQWRPKYLGSPPGLASPMVLANIATLISGGLSRIVPSPRKPATRPPRLKLPTLKDRAA